MPATLAPLSAPSAPLRALSTVTLVDSTPDTSKEGGTYVARFFASDAVRELLAPNVIDRAFAFNRWDRIVHWNDQRVWLITFKGPKGAPVTLAFLRDMEANTRAFILPEELAITVPSEGLITMGPRQVTATRPAPASDNAPRSGQTMAEKLASLKDAIR